MRQSMKWMSALVALALMVCFSGSPLRAEDAPKAAAGSVSGTVVDKDGKPVANITVNLHVAVAAKGKAKLEIGDRVLGKKKGDKGAKGAEAVPAVATATTGADGAFSMPNVPVGDYVAEAGSAKDPAGHGRATVSVKEGANATVTITLMAHKAK